MGKPLSFQDFWGGRWPCSAATACCPAFPVILRQYDPGLPQIEEAKRSRKGDKCPRVELSLPRRSALGFCLLLHNQEMGFCFALLMVNLRSWLFKEPRGGRGWFKSTVERGSYSRRLSMWEHWPQPCCFQGGIPVPGVAPRSKHLAESLTWLSPSQQF